MFILEAIDHGNRLKLGWAKTEPPKLRLAKESPQCSRAGLTCGK